MSTRSRRSRRPAGSPSTPQPLKVQVPVGSVGQNFNAPRLRQLPHRLDQRPQVRGPEGRRLRRRRPGPARLDDHARRHDGGRAGIRPGLDRHRSGRQLQLLQPPAGHLHGLRGAAVAVAPVVPGGRHLHRHALERPDRHGEDFGNYKSADHDRARARRRHREGAGTAVHDTATCSEATSDAGGTVTYTSYPSLADCLAGTNGTAAGTNLAIANGVVPKSKHDHLPDARHVLLAGRLQRRREQRPRQQRLRTRGDHGRPAAVRRPRDLQGVRQRRDRRVVHRSPSPTAPARRIRSTVVGGTCSEPDPVADRARRRSSRISRAGCGRSPTIERRARRRTSSAENLPAGTVKVHGRPRTTRRR